MTFLLILDDKFLLFRCFIRFLFNNFRGTSVVCFPTDILIGGHTSPLQHDVEVGEVAEEEQGAQIEEAGDSNDNLEFN